MQTPPSGVDFGPSVTPPDAAKLISHASHQLRAPLAALRGATDLLREDFPVEAPEARELLEMIARNSRRLETAVTDITMFARVMHGCYPMPTSEFDVDECVSAAAANVGPAAALRTMRVRASTIGAVRMFHGAKDAFLAIVGHLLDNAIKFGPRRSDVVLDVSVSADLLHISVADGGERITGVDRDNLFTPFHHRARGDDIQSSGIGLGLFLVRALARLHGGDAEYADQTDGHRFTVNLRRMA